MTNIKPKQTSPETRIGCRRRRPGSSGLASGLYECCWTGAVIRPSRDAEKSRTCPLLNASLAYTTASACVMVLNGISLGFFGASIALPFYFWSKIVGPFFSQADYETAVKLEHNGRSDRVLLVVWKAELIDGRDTPRLCKADYPLRPFAGFQIARRIHCRSKSTKRLGSKTANLAH